MKRAAPEVAADAICAKPPRGLHADVHDGVPRGVVVLSVQIGALCF